MGDIRIKDYSSGDWFESYSDFLMDLDSGASKVLDNFEKGYCEKAAEYGKLFMEVSLMIPWLALSVKASAPDSVRTLVVSEEDLHQAFKGYDIEVLDQLGEAEEMKIDFAGSDHQDRLESIRGIYFRKENTEEFRAVELPLGAYTELIDQSSADRTTRGLDLVNSLMSPLRDTGSNPEYRL